MEKFNPSKLKKHIVNGFTFIPKAIRKLNRLSNHLLQISNNLTLIHSSNNIEIAKQILEKNKLDLMLDNISCPEEGRKVLNLLFKIQYSLPNNHDNIIIARHSLMHGYLSPIIKQLQLQIAPLDTHLNAYFRNLPKAPSIYSLDSAFSTLLFNDNAYLRKLRVQCKNELIIAVKVNIEKPQENSSQANNIYNIDKNEIYYTDHHIRWMLHYIGFFEVLGPFTCFSDDYFTRSRMITPEGDYAVLFNKNLHPSFKGLSIYRAATKTFRQYSETSI